MSRRQPGKPPARLPEAFLEIWRVLSEAEAVARSRRELASRLGVSTETLQRILVRGDVPEFATLDNPRVVHAWTRTITRLADAFGRDPRSWVEQVGIPWSDGIARVSRSALERRRLRRRRSAEPGPAAAWQATAAGSTRDAGGARGRRPPALRVGVVGREAFRTFLPSYGATVFDVLAERLAKAIDPDSDVELVTAAEHEIVAQLQRVDPPMPFAVGVGAAAHRLRWDLEFVPIPGFGVRLGALCCGPAREGREAWAWGDVVRADSEAGARMVVDDVAGAFVRGQCGIRADRVVESSARDAEALGGMLAREVQARGSLALVADEELCARTEVVLRSAGEHRWPTTLIAGCDSSPRYALAVAVPSRDRRLRRLIEVAVQDGLLGSYRSHTMDLIAEHLVCASLETRPTPRRAWQLERLDRWPGVREELLRSLLLAVGRALDLRPPDKASGRRERAFRQVLRLVPPAWRSALARSAGVADASVTPERRHPDAEVAAPRHFAPAPPPPAALASHHCRSCSVSLTDASNRGISDRYCRYCADEEGRLKPRAEVQRLIAAWMADWQGDLQPDEALQRAALFMRAMPAWSEN